MLEKFHCCWCCYGISLLWANTVLYASGSPQAALGPWVCWLFREEREHKYIFSNRESFLSWGLFVFFFFPANLVPYASRVLFSTCSAMFLMLTLKTGQFQQKAENWIQTSKAIPSLWLFRITDMVCIRIIKESSLKIQLAPEWKIPSLPLLNFWVRSWRYWQELSQWYQDPKTMWS